MDKSSCCAQAVDCADADPTRLFFAGMARGAASVWRDVLYLVDSALLPIAWLITQVRSWDSKGRRAAMLSDLSDRALRDVGLARGTVEFLAGHPEEARDDRFAPCFE